MSQPVLLNTQAACPPHMLAFGFRLGSVNPPAPPPPLPVKKMGWHKQAGISTTLQAKYFHILLSHVPLDRIRVLG